MDNRNFFFNPLENVQFFSTVNSILILGEILYNTKSPIEGKLEPIPIINTLCEFLEKNKQNEHLILALGHKLLRNTDLYGSKENETLHLKFVSDMFDNMIANTVFSKFGNTYGYLSTIVNSTSDLKLSSVKERITRNLQRQKFLNNNSTFFFLSNFTISRITENIIFPLFPQPKNKMKITNLKYIYAQAGWTLLRNAQQNLTNFKFRALISLAHHVEQEVLLGKADPSALQIFQLPALLYYTHQKENGIKRRKLKSLMSNTNFWQRVYNLLFTDRDVTLDKMTAVLKQNPIYNFLKALRKYKTRSALAEELLRRNCPSGTGYENEIIDYKNNPDDYYCGTTKKLQPNLNELFENQNRIIAKKYFRYEKYLIHQVFDADLKKFIDQTNVKIQPLAVFWKNRCFRCAIYSNRPTLDENTDLFQITDGSVKRIFALIHNKSGGKLLEARDINSFLEEIGLNSRAKLDIPFMAENMKSATERDNFNSFAIYIAKSRERKFSTQLRTSGYEATTLEKVKDFFLHLIPFYSCFESVSSASVTKAVVDCALDSLVMIPLFGELTSIGVKISSATRSALWRLAIIKPRAVKESLQNVLKDSLRVFALEVSQSFSQVITKELIRNLCIAFLRTLDPGIEFLTMLSKAGATTLMNIYKSLKTKISLTPLKNLNSIKIGTYRGHEVHVSSITGQDGFGLKKISLQGKTVELRKLRGYANEMPVVLVNNSKKRRKYQIIDLDTGKIGKTEWEEKDGILVIAEKPFAVRLRILKTEGLSGKGSIRKDLFRTEEYNVIQTNRIVASKLAEFPLDQEIISEILMKHVLINVVNTPMDFVFHWLNHKTFPEWSKDYKLLDATLYEHLRFSSFLGDVNLSRKKAIKGIYDLYGGQYVRDVIKVDMNKLYNFYNTFQLHDAITFSDQFALANFMASGFSKIILDDFEAWSMKRAFYKTALRQFDDVTLIQLNEEYLYTSEPVVDLSQQLYKGKVIDVNAFTVLNGHMDEFVANLKQTENTERVVHKIKIYQQYLMVDLKKYLPITTNEVVLLPGIQLQLVDWVFMEVKGHKVTVINWENVDFDQGKWLADTANKIKILIDHEQEMYDKIANFDTSLFQR